MTTYIQYDPTQVDVNNYCSFDTIVTFDPNLAAPQPISPILQFTVPDGVLIDGMVLDLSQTPPALVPPQPDSPA